MHNFTYGGYSMQCTGVRSSRHQSHQVAVQLRKYYLQSHVTRWFAFIRWNPEDNREERK